MLQENKKLFVIDTFALIFRSYYALKSNNNFESTDHKPTGAIYGFYKMIISLARAYQPDYLIFALDSPGDTFRHELSDIYKKNRKETPTDLQQQIPLIVEMIQKMNVPAIAKKGFEADDIIGSVVQTCENLNGNQVDIAIISSDKDLLQLVDERTSVFMMRKGVSQMDVYDKERVYAKWGVYPHQIVDLLALIGDSSDNICGVSGIGKKRGAQLIQNYGSLDKIYRDVESIPSKMIQRKLQTDRHLAYLARQLVEIRRDLNIDSGCFRPIDLAQIRDVDISHLLNQNEMNGDSLF